MDEQTNRKNKWQHHFLSCSSQLISFILKSDWYWSHKGVFLWAQLIFREDLNARKHFPCILWLDIHNSVHHVLFLESVFIMFNIFKLMFYAGCRRDEECYQNTFAQDQYLYNSILVPNSNPRVNLNWDYELKIISW